MVNKNWADFEEDLFWNYIIPRSPKQKAVDAVRHPAQSWEELAKVMNHMIEVRGLEKRRVYTGLGLFEHYFQNAESLRLSPSAAHHVVAYWGVEEYNRRRAERNGRPRNARKAKMRKQGGRARGKAAASVNNSPASNPDRPGDPPVTMKPDHGQADPRLLVADFAPSPAPPLAVIPITPADGPGMGEGQLPHPTAGYQPPAWTQLAAGYQYNPQHHHNHNQQHQQPGWYSQPHHHRYDHPYHRQYQHQHQLRYHQRAAEPGDSHDSYGDTLDSGQGGGWLPAAVPVTGPTAASSRQGPMLDSPAGTGTEEFRPQISLPPPPPAPHRLPRLAPPPLPDFQFRPSPRRENQALAAPNAAAATAHQHHQPGNREEDGGGGGDAPHEAVSQQEWLRLFPREREGH